MRSITLGLLVAALLPSGAALAGPGFEHDDTVYPDDLLASSEPRRVEVVITDRGLEPTVVRHGREKLELVVRRESSRACRGDLLVPEFGLRAPAPAADPVTLTVLGQGRGAFHLTCPREDVVDDAPAGQTAGNDPAPSGVSGGAGGSR